MKTLRGVVGYLDWYHYTAATVHGYVVVRDDAAGGYRLTGIVGERDAFKLTQRPLEFVAPAAGGALRWPVIDFSVSDSNRLVARLGTEG